MSPQASQTDRLYARLARLALDLDDVASEVAAAELDHGEAEGLEVVAADVRLGAEAIEDALWRAQQFDERQRAWRDPLRSVRPL